MKTTDQDQLEVALLQALLEAPMEVTFLLEARQLRVADLQETKATTHLLAEHQTATLLVAADQVEHKVRPHLEKRIHQLQDKVHHQHHLEVAVAVAAAVHLVQLEVAVEVN